MGHSILILDDDEDFNCLLTDIFEQADYAVTSAQDPIKALEIFESGEFELVVSDHKMPGMSGAEFMKRAKELHPEVPVIMVSGYLDNDTIRELIGAGVGGVFLKPLNIFSLLERTAELIAENDKARERLDSNQVHESAGNEGQYDKIGFNFRSFPCKSEKSLKFANRIHSLMDFSSSLTLVGESGTRYRAICEDIRGFYNDPTEHFIYLSPNSFDGEQVLSMVAEVQANGASRVTCVLVELERMTEAQKVLARELSKRSGVFEGIDLPLRTIFCINGDLDLLLDEGVIDENLYMLMGTAEVLVPPLRDCASDIPILAQQLAVEFTQTEEMASVPRFERAARDLLQSQPLTGNYEELSEIVRKVMEHASGEVLTKLAVEDALQQVIASSPRGLVEKYLIGRQVDYIGAVSKLLGGDHQKIATFFGSEVAKVETLVN